MEQYWENAAKKSAEKKKFQKKFKLFGKKARRKGYTKSGIIIIQDEEEFIQYGDNHIEPLFGFDFELWDDLKEKWIIGEY